MKLDHRHGLGRAVLGLAVVLASGACAAGARSTADPFSGGGSGAPSTQDRSIHIEVQNSNFNDATIEARGIGIRRRLGRVGGSRSDEFTLDWRGAGQLYFEIDLLGGGTCVTRGIDVSPGDRVRLVIDSMARTRADGMNRICDARRIR
jgi:hypothetical protein